MKKASLIILVSILLVSMLAACASAPEAAPETTEAETQEEAAPAEEEAEVEEAAEAAPAADIVVAAVVGGEIGDKGFVDSANEGLIRMEEELGIKTMILQGRDEPDRYLDLLLSAAEEADLVFIIPGYFFEEQIAQVVPEFPDTTFVYVDGQASLEDMMSIRFLENEGSFLAGALAAKMTTRTDVLDMADDAKVVGVMGGADMPVIHNFMVGFLQGVSYADAEVEALDKFAGTHFDPAKGKETALSMYEDGADILFQVAGPTGLGVFEAAKEANKYVIGVDTNQKPLAPENTIASMRKRVGDSIFDFTQMFINGETTPGTLYPYGLAKNGVGIDYGESEPDLVPQDVKDYIDELSQQIINGEIAVDEYVD